MCEETTYVFKVFLQSRPTFLNEIIGFTNWVDNVNWPP